MRRIIVLDTGVAGVLTRPQASAERIACRAWFDGLRATQDLVMLPAIVDYELRREMPFRRAVTSIRHLNRLAREAKYIPLDSRSMHQAAAIWAQTRHNGQPTADRHALNGDVILAAQASLLDDPGGEIIIATANVKHLIRFADARLWTDIRPTF